MPPPARPQAGETAARSKPGSSGGSHYHGGEPHSRVNEEFWGLGRSLLDSPQRDGHVEGAQDDEGEPQHLEKQMQIRLR